MDLMLKITKKEGTNMSSLVKQMCALKSRIKVELESGVISIVEMDDSNIEKVIDSIDEAFDILAVDIIPTIEIPEPVITQDSLEIAKIEFANPEVEEQVNKLMRTIYWAMYSNKASAQNVCKYLASIGREISMEYAPYERIKFEVGDVVDCDFGKHHSAELSGAHVHAIVCDIDDEGLVYTAPITKMQINGNPQKYMLFEAKMDVDYNDPKFYGGTVLLKKGRYIRPQRIQSVVGHARPDFFNKLVAALPRAIDFLYENYEEELAERLGDVQNDDHMLNFETEVEVPIEETFDEDAREAPVEETFTESASEAPVEESFNENGNKTRDSNSIKKPSSEDYVTTLIEDALEALDKSKPVAEQVDVFLDSIGFTSKEKIIKQAFVAACEVKKIGYESILIEVKNVFPKLKEEIIKATMREEFKKWLDNYPEAKEKYPRLSIITLLKLFAKKMY